MQVICSIILSSMEYCAEYVNFYTSIVKANNFFPENLSNNINPPKRGTICPFYTSCFVYSLPCPFVVSFTHGVLPSHSVHQNRDSLS